MLSLCFVSVSWGHRPTPTPTPGPRPEVPSSPPLPTNIYLTVQVYLEALTGSQSVLSSPFPLLFHGEGLYWKTDVKTDDGAVWLTMTSAQGLDDNDLRVQANIGSLKAGTYAARVNVVAAGATNPVLRIPVSFTVARQKAILAANGIVNAASLRAGPIAPGQLITLAGDRMGPRSGLSAKPNESTNRYGTSLDGTRILFDGLPGVVLYSSLNQINAQVPYEIAGKSAVKITVESAGFDASEPVEMRVADTAPGMFSIDGVRAAALNQDYSYNTPSTPIAAGDGIQLFLTGQGLTTPRVETGVLAPGAVGLLQVNVRIPPPATAPSNNVLVGARLGNNGLPGALHIAVKAADPQQ